MRMCILTDEHRKISLDNLFDENWINTISSFFDSEIDSEWLKKDKVQIGKWKWISPL